MTTPTDQSPPTELTPQRARAISKFLTKHLRHTPQKLGLTLQPDGYVYVSDLLRACAAAGFPITEPELDRVVAGEFADKVRMAFDNDDHASESPEVDSPAPPPGRRVRALQGHSAAVELRFELAAVPASGRLYHGTCGDFVPSIMEEGLRRMRRHHVHLSGDEQTARKVGERRVKKGGVVVLAVDARAMEEAGAAFYLAENGVWLVDHVDARCLSWHSGGE